MIAMYSHRCLTHACPGKWTSTTADTACLFCGSDRILVWRPTA